MRKKLLINSEVSHYVPLPADLADLDYFVSSDCPSGVLFVGDFREVAFGVRHEARIEISNESRFREHEVEVKVVVRIDFAALRPTAITRLISIS